MSNSLRHTILGLLLDRPMHGYELKRALTPAVSRDRQVNDGVLYPLLQRLEREGLIRKTVVRRTGGPDRHVLRPTTKGARAFSDWLEGSDGEADLVTYDFFLGHPFLNKCMFFDRLPREAVLSKLERHEAAARDKLAEFERLRAAMADRGVAPLRLAVLDLGIGEQRAKVRWVRRLRREVSRNPAALGISPEPGHGRANRHAEGRGP